MQGVRARVRGQYPIEISAAVLLLFVRGLIMDCLGGAHGLLLVLSFDGLDGRGLFGFDRSLLGGI
jgi:hypothetical protein